jgi:STE24 endopeptidase
MTVNIFFYIILGTLIFSWLLNLIANYLNLRALQPELPDVFADVFSPEKYRRSQDYTKHQTRFGLVSGTFDLIVLLAFWFAGGFNWLDHLVRSYAESPILAGLLFLALLSAANYLISLPFSLYHTFVLEEKYGFNKTTLKTYILDQLKGMALGIFIGGGMLALILWIFNEFGDNAWLYAAGFTIVFMLIMQVIAPIWIMPLFNKFTPLPDGELKDKVLELLDRVKFPVAGLFVMDGSKRSAKSNAFFTGIGRHKRIALFDTLIEKHSTEELLAVLAHEVGHYKKRHIQMGMVMSFVQVIVMFFVFGVFLENPGLFAAFGMDNLSVYASLLFFGLLFAPLSLVLSILSGILSRHNEFAADRFAVEQTQLPGAMTDALKKLSADNLSNLTPHPFFVFLNYSHPPVLQRIAAIEKI